MSNNEKDLFDFMAKYISKSDFYVSMVIAKISVLIYKFRTNLKRIANKWITTNKPNRNRR